MNALDDHWFEELFNAIDPFTWIVDSQGIVLKANRATQALTDATRAATTGVPLWSLPWRGLTAQQKRSLKAALEQALAGQSIRHDLEIHPRGQPGMTVALNLKPIRLDGDTPQYVFAQGHDITAYKQTSEALNQSQARFHAIYEKAGMGILIKDVSGKMLDCNPAFQAMLGYSAKELARFSYLDITHPLDRKLSRKLFDELVSGKRKSYQIEKRYLRKDGQDMWARITASSVAEPDRETQFIIAIVENVTAQKEIETELAELRRRLMHGREMERLRIAQDLHDGPLQEIIDLTYRFNELEEAPADESSQEQIGEIKAALKQLARSVRMICGELRPPTLVPFGLEKTIRSHAEQFQEAHPELTIRLDLAEDGLALSEPIRIVLFRIYQAALNNIVRHAEASRVRIQLRLHDRQAILTIQDNGKGFNLPRRWITLARQGHLGLVGARERAQEVGGDLKVTTHPGKGTRIQAMVPFDEESGAFSNHED